MFQVPPDYFPDMKNNHFRMTLSDIGTIKSNPIILKDIRQI